MSSSAITFDDDVPPAGTACYFCKAFGHWCQARRYFTDGEAEFCICIPCAEGRDCAVVAAKSQEEETVLDRFQHPLSPVKVIKPASGVKCVPVAEPKTGSFMPYVVNAAAVAIRKPEPQRERFASVSRDAWIKANPGLGVIVDENVLLDFVKKGGCEGDEMAAAKQMVTPEQVQAIREAPEDETARSIAMRLGIPEKNCSRWLTIVRKERLAERRNLKGGALRSQVKPVSVVRVKAPSPAPAVVRQPAVKPSSDASITLPVTFTLAGMDAWWNRLGLAEKASIVYASIVF